MIKISVSASSQIGMVRDHNEDAVLISKQLLRDNHVNTSVLLGAQDRYVVAVCDGLGGQNAGEVASMDVAEQLAKRIDSLPANLSIDALHVTLNEWVEEEHEYLLMTGKDDACLEGLGTTLVSMLFYENHICWMNCGDSRLYRLRNGILRQLSSDHSLMSMTHKLSDAHVIVNCLGGGAETAFIDFVDVTNDVREKDVFLLCSDGLSCMVVDDAIEAALVKTLDASDLVNIAVQNGGLDNVSACIVSVDSMT